MRSIASLGAVLALLSVVAFACNEDVPVGADDGGTTTSCAAAGGKCVLGSVSCTTQAASTAQDCNPDLNPGGAFCCLDTETADAGDCAGQEAPPCAPPPSSCAWEGPTCVDGKLGCGTLVCTDAGTGDTTSCAAAGGKCVLGSVSCATQAPSAAQDCNPDRNPGGAFCCLDTGTADAGDCAGQVAPPCAPPPSSCTWEGPTCVDGKLGCGTLVCTDAGTSDAGSCVEVDAASYPTSCTAASDCTVVASGDICTGSCACPTVPVNTQGESDYEQATKGIDTAACPCAEVGVPACVNGVCVVSDGSG